MIGITGAACLRRENGVMHLTTTNNVDWFIYVKPRSLKTNVQRVLAKTEQHVSTTQEVFAVNVMMGLKEFSVIKVSGKNHRLF